MSQIGMQVKEVRSSAELELLSRIEAFDLDSHESKLPFSRRLARDNSWDHDYAQRVVAEYKRFAFLAMVAGHPVTPSDAVDQAWHLHMVYTESYWKEFCGQVLRKPLHHGPTRGGAQEGAKHFDWYTRTLESYRHWFNSEPPEEIWPSPANRFRHASEFVRINRSETWIVQKPVIWRKTEQFFSGTLLRHLTPDRSLILKRSALALVVLIAAGCSGKWDVLNYTGREFLSFYFWLALLSFVAAACLRWSRRTPARSATEEDLPTDPYAIAYLAGGPVRMAESALSELLRAGALQIGAKGKIQATASATTTTGRHPVETQLLAEFSPYVGKSFSAAQKQFASLPDVITEDLRERGLILSEAARSSIRNGVLTLALLAPSIGFVKLLIGISRDKPVAFLVIGLVITTVLAIALFGRKPLRTRLGDNVLNRLKEQYAPLRLEGALEAGPGLSQGALATTVGLFGMSMLANTAHANEYSKLRQSYQSSSGDSGSSGCGSSDSGSSDGGSGCGGGCGGCGGGGGD